MATTFEKVNEYDHENEEWRHYVERFDHFFTANEITDKDKRRSVFLVSVGAKTYKLIRSLVAPGDPKELTYEELAKIVEEHYQGPEGQSLLFLFNVLNSTRQQPGSEHCEFGSTVDEMLRDRLVCGTKDEKIQHRLLAEPKLTLKRALDLAIAIKTSERDALDLKKDNPVGQGDNPVNTLVQKPRDTRQGHKHNTTNVKCSRCDGKTRP